MSPINYGWMSQVYQGCMPTRQEGQSSESSWATALDSIELIPDGPFSYGDPEDLIPEILLLPLKNVEAPEFIEYEVESDEKWEATGP